MTPTNRHYAETPQGRTAYLDHGTGPALVLIHGVGLNASVWAPQIEAFGSAYRVIAYDTLGHGGSALPASAASLSGYAAQLHGLLDCLDVDRAVLLGHSMGALISILFAADYGDRVQAVIAANPVYRRPQAQLAVSRSRARELERGGPEATLGEALRRWFGEAEGLDASRVDRVEQWLREADPRGYARAYRAFTEADPLIDGRPAELTMPALFVTGALDPNSTPSMARALASETPLGRATVLEGERHMMAYASPARFNAVVEAFLSRAIEPRRRAAADRAELSRA